MDPGTNIDSFVHSKPSLFVLCSRKLGRNLGLLTGYMFFFWVLSGFTEGIVFSPTCLMEFVIGRNCTCCWVPDPRIPVVNRSVHCGISLVGLVLRTQPWVVLVQL